MNHDVIITCALTGAGDTASKSHLVPVTPKQIAAAAVEAAKAGATVVHCHVRDPQTGRFSRDVALYREVMERIREADVDIIVNLTAGMGGDLEIGPDENPMAFGQGTDLIGPLELGVKAELEIFDTGHLWFAKQMIKEGLLDNPLFQLCLGIPWGAPADTTTMKAMVDNLPANATWAGFGIGRMQMPMAAQAVLLGGNVRVGLEDNLYLDRGVLASNGQLVERAVEIISRLGARVLSPAEGRAKMNLNRR